MVGVPGARAIKDSLRYGFAVGKVRVLQTRVFRQATYERLIDAGTYAEQRKILSDSVYGAYLEGADTVEQVEAALERALDDAYRFLDEAKLPDAIVRFFRVRYDYTNARAIIKARVVGAASEGLLRDLGTAPIEVLEGPVERWPEHLRTLATELIPAAESDEEPPSTERIDATCERAMYAELRRLARASGSPFLKDLVALEIDLANARAAIRARRKGLPLSVLREGLIEGGTLSHKALEKAYALPFDAFVEVLARGPRLKGIPASDLEDPARLDVITDDVAVRFLRSGRLVPIGAEPVIAYVIAREAEIKAVRTLLVGKLSGLGPDALRARLREVYV